MQGVLLSLDGFSQCCGLPAHLLLQLLLLFTVAIYRCAVVLSHLIFLVQRRQHNAA
jgi:hypothetical protein